MMTGLVLSACHSVKHKEVIRDGWKNDTEVFSDRQAWHNELYAWKLTAKIAISTPQIKESANLVWQVNGDSNVMRLFGPLGVGSIRIEFDSNGVTLTDTRGRTHQGRSAEALLSRITGWPIPISALKYWLFVVPEPKSVTQYLMNEDAVVAIGQRGWQIDYSKFQEPNGLTPSLPKKIVATKTAFYGGVEETAKVRLVVKSWTRL